jgi:hypothetical protein
MCAGLEQDVEEGRCAGTYLAGAFELLGERELALEILERAVRRRDTLLPWLSCEPAWDPLREHPRFQNLLVELRLPAAAGSDSALPARRS